MSTTRWPPFCFILLNTVIVIWILFAWEVLRSLRIIETIWRQQWTIVCFSFSHITAYDVVAKINHTHNIIGQLKIIFFLVLNCNDRSNDTFATLKYPVITNIWTKHQFFRIKSLWSLPFCLFLKWLMSFKYELMKYKFI